MEKQVYHLSQEGIKKNKQLIIKSFAITFSIVIAMFTYSFWNVDFREQENWLTGFMFFLSIMMITTTIYGMQKRIEIMNSFTIEIEEDSITRKQKDTPEITIYNKNIESIQNKEGKGLLIKTNEKDMIYIPAAIEGYQYIYNHAITLKSIEPLKSPEFLNIKFILSILSGICTIALFFDINTYLRGICAVIALLGMIYNFILIRESKHLDKNVKRVSWLMLFLLFPIIGSLLTVFDIGGINSANTVSK
ncbi:MAG: hypothetical protein MUE81_14640 [Thermoflexibacter sp.]|jgi:cell division protein FtsW (lipid II flippase)|nr:hypothetical protein [Thermoflexibacter sp.]